MTNNERELVYNYFDTYIKSRQNEFHDFRHESQPSWETLMTLLKCIEEEYDSPDFHFHDNYFRIEYKEDGKYKRVQDKGINLKEAIVYCCFKLLSDKDKEAPKVQLPTEDFLLDD